MASFLPGSVTLKLDIEISVLREGQLEHGRIGMVIEHMSWNVSPIERLPHLVSCFRVTILNKGLKTGSLLKGGQLVNKAKSAEDQM